MQLKFPTDRDFIHALNIMKDLGLPISERGVNPPPTVAQSMSLVSSSLSSTSEYSANNSALSKFMSRPGSVNQACISGDTATSILTASSLSDGGFKVPQRPSSTLSEGYKAISNLPYSVPRPPRPHSAASVPSLARQASFQESPARRSSLYLSQMEREVCAYALPIPDE